MRLPRIIVMCTVNRLTYGLNYGLRRRAYFLWNTLVELKLDYQKLAALFSVQDIEGDGAS
uniref:Uncharacterized protein n=1 Tax=Physcomitrium patens TaxID=3218 RepID=A0A2K1KGV0_PHYPA|nr:hypothetical protein PHYPA_009386 [Physcomitrium patens]